MYASFLLSFQRFFIEHSNLFSLTSLCQEYQVDWLMRKVESYLEEIELSTSDRILEYLRVASGMDFEVAFDNILNQINESFPYLQTNKLFTILERKTQVVIARKRLYLLLQCLNKLKTIPTGIQKCIDGSIVSVFPDAEQLFQELWTNDYEEEDYINKFVIPPQLHQMYIPCA